VATNNAGLLAASGGAAGNFLVGIAENAGASGQYVPVRPCPMYLHA